MEQKKEEEEEKKVMMTGETKRKEMRKRRERLKAELGLGNEKREGGGVARGGGEFWTKTETKEGDRMEARRGEERGTAR